LKKTLLKNLNVINPTSVPSILDNAFVVISGDTIESVTQVEPKEIFEVVHNFNGKIALPGMINAHHHLY